jgi:hypothetical protein
MSSDARKVVLNDLKLFSAFKLRHPLIPGPGKQALRFAWQAARMYMPVRSRVAARALRARMRAGSSRDEP